jgi:transcriptional regulator with XRE-family HTH domain
VDIPPDRPAHSRAGSAARFRELREGLGLSQRELASVLGTSASAILDLETNDDELFVRYSAREVCLIASALGVGPLDLLNRPTAEPPITGEEFLAILRQCGEIREGCMTEFEDRTGGRITVQLESPDHLLADLTVDALQRLCETLAIDWRRVMAGCQLPDESTR